MLFGEPLNHEMIRAFAKRLGVGRAVAIARRVLAADVATSAKRAYVRRHILPKIASLSPLPAGGDFEVHMLLNGARLLEGVWALYSFFFFATVPGRIVIHDDGTLGSAGAALLVRLFPGSRVIGRRQADDIMNARLRALGLSRCQRLRESLVFGLKLFDPVFFAQSPRILLLDSDVLFYRMPTEVLASLEGNAPPVFFPDNGDRYCLPAEAIASLLGLPPVRGFNPGVASIPVASIEFQRMEQFLEDPAFWTKTGAANYFAELTLWAMEMTLAGAVPLSAGYQICAPVPADEAVISGHYCGGGYWAAKLYTEGVPFLWNEHFGKNHQEQRRVRA